MLIRSVIIIFRLYLVLILLIIYFVDQFYNDQLQDVFEGVDLVYVVIQVVQGFFLEKEKY